MATVHTPGPWHIYEPTLCIADADDLIVAEASFHRGREASRANAVLIAAAPALAAAIYYLGGGSVYLEAHGRLCFCPRHGTGEMSKHATGCNEAWKAWQDAGSPLPPGETLS